MISTGNGATILNVDDTEAALYAKTRALQRAGYNVVDASTGAEALRLVAEMSPDLVLLDVKLPDINGIEVCSRIKADHPHIIVLQISATFTDRHARISGLNAGADAYVTQPIEADELIANVRALLRLKSAEDQLRRMKQTLEEQVEERTRDMKGALEQLRAEMAGREAAEAALRQSQKVEAIGQLTGGVAHDFNNLLTIIRASADLLRRQELSPDKQRRYVDAISDTADRAAKLTGQLLAFARRQTLKPEVFDVGERVVEITSMLQTIVGSRIVITADVGTYACCVLADPSQLETALVNMTVNARDAMNGEGRLSISVRGVDEIPAVRSHAGVRGRYVALTISDSGSGIAPAVLPSIFDPFYTTKDVGKGTGLGLSQVHGFVKQSGGEVQVESVVGRGAKFTLYLPMVDPPAAAPSTSEAGPIARNKGGEILVVEDNKEVGEFAGELLEDLGYTATWVGGANKALEILKDEPERFALVFTDVVMAEMSGIELAKTLRDLGILAPILLTSGYSHVLAEEGTHGFPLLQKPYSVEGLSKALREAILQGTVHR